MAGAPTREVLRYHHSGAGRRQARGPPKGRAVQPQAKHEIATLLSDRPRTSLRWRPWFLTPHAAANNDAPAEK